MRAGHIPGVRRAGRRSAGAAALLALLLVTVPVPGRARAAWAATTGPTIELADAASAVELNGTAAFRLRVDGVPDDAEVDLVVFTAVDAAGLRAAEQGELPSRQVGFLPRVPLSTVRQPDGSVLVSFTVVGQPPQFDDEIRIPDPGVYPVRLRVLGAGSTQELARTVVFLERPRPGVSLPVAVVLPVSGAPATAPDGTVAPAAADVARLGAISQFLADRPTFPLTIAPRPELLDAMTRTNRGLLDQLAVVASRAGLQVLARTYVRVDVPAMSAANLVGEVGNQLALGERAVTDALPGVRPDRRVWLSDGPLDPTALAALGRLGVQAVLMKADQLQPTPSGPADRPVAVATSDASLPMQALVVEPTSDSVLDRPTGLSPVVAAHRLVAELAVRALEPDIGRGSLLVADEAWTVDGPYLRALADAVSASTLVQAVTVDDYLRRTVPERGQIRRVATRPSIDLTTYAQGLFVTRIAIDHLASTLPPTTKLFDGLAGMLTMAGSADFDAARRQAYLDAANTRLLPVRQAIRAVAREQVTLAGRDGKLPIVVSNAFDEPVSVRLRIDSSKLTVSENDRVVTVPARGSLTVEIPVEARTSAWRFPVRVDLTTPVGDDSMAPPVVFDLRVVGLSGLGIGVSAAAGLVLLTWWLTHARTRRRKQRAAATGGGATPSDGADPPAGPGPSEPIVV